MPLEIEHVRPKALGGNNRISNHVLACRSCNQRKAGKPIELFLNDQPARLRRVLVTFKDAAEANDPLDTGRHTENDRSSCRGRERWENQEKPAALGQPQSPRAGRNLRRERGWRSRLGSPSAGVKAPGRGAYRRTCDDTCGFPCGYQQAAGYASEGNQVEYI